MTKAKRFLSMLLALCLVLGLVPTMAFAADGIHPFTDVSDTAWYSDAVQYVYEHDMMVGTSSTKFSPDSPTSRGMIVTILHRLEGLPSATGTAFSDVPAGQWYTDAVAWASANNIVNGYGNGKFGPNDPITREQMAAILYHYAEYKEYDTSITGSAITFADGEQVSAYAVDAVNWAIGVGLLQGVGNNKLSPASGATRAQTATILMRFCESIAAPEYHTVTFEYNYGSKGTYDTVTVEHGKTVIRPTNPTRSGYTFSGWYTEASGGSKFDFSTAITSDFTLYAHWTSASSGSGDFTPSPTTYTVTFDSNGGSAVPAQTVENGATATVPAEPTKEGYVFGGWHTSPSNDSPFDFSDNIINSNVILYAFWIDERLDDEEDSCCNIQLTDIAYDDEMSITYANNVILMYVEPNVSEAYCQRLIDNVDGSFAGRLKGAVNILQIKIAATDLSGIESICNKLESCDGVIYATYDSIITSNYVVSNSFTDPWGGDVDVWNESHPDGSNWYMEAIELDSAYKYQSDFNHVNLGVLDGGFDVTHEDLQNKLVLSNAMGVLPDEAKAEGDNDHGTMVSGIIAASHNDVGVTGIIDDCTVYCAANKNFDTMHFAKTLKVFVEDYDVRVFNFSFGWAIYEDDIPSLKTYVDKANNRAKIFTPIICDLIKNYDNFLVVQSAGNGYKNEAKDDFENGLPAVGVVLNDPLTKDTVDNILEDYAMSRTDFDSHIITVGAASSLRAGSDEDQYIDYRLANYSNYGDNVDICAPSGSAEGERIYVLASTANGKYDSNSFGGTSAAAPMVSGVVGLVWSIDSGLKPAKVKDIVCNNYNCRVVGHGRSDGKIYHMLNARLSVEAAIEAADRNKSYSITGKVINSETSDPIDEVNVYLNCIFGNAGADIGATATTASDGTFKLTIPENATAVTGIQFEKDGYSSYLFPLVANVNSSFDIGTVRLTPIAVDPIITPAISGTVRDADTGLALNNVEVYGYDADGYGPLFTGHTGSDGAFSIALEESGTYSMKFNKEGYEEYILSDIVVTSGTALVGTISLTATQLPDDGIIYISTPEQFDAIRNDLTGNYALATDIDLSSYTSWDPIGSNSDSFSGTLDGRGHKITGLTITKDVLAQESRVGLFNTVSGTIKDLTVENAEIRVQYGYSIDDTGGYTYWGIVAGMLTSSGTIDNCSVSGNMLVDYIGCINAGGIAGGGGNITNCQSACDIDFTLSLSNSTWVIIGGITGYDGKIKDCINRGDVSLIAHLSGWAADQYFYQGNTNWITVDGIGLASKENCTNTGSVRKNVY